MTTLEGYVSTSGEYPVSGNEVLSIEVSDTNIPTEPGIVYANPDVPYSVIQELATGAGGLKLPSNGGSAQQTKQIVIYNDPNAARKAIEDLGLKATLIDAKPPTQ